MGGDMDIKLKFAEALEFSLEDKPMLKVTVSDVVSASGLSRQTFYRHFKDIFDLINWTHREKTRLALAIYHEHEGLEASFRMSLKLMLRHKRFYQQIVSIEGPNSFYSYYCACLKEGILLHIGTDHADDEIMFSVNLYATGATQQIVKWIKDKMLQPPEYIAKLLVRSLPANLRKFSL